MQECYVILDCTVRQTVATILTTQYKDQARKDLYMKWENLYPHEKEARTAFVLLTANVYEGGNIDYESLKMVEKIK